MDHRTKEGFYITLPSNASLNVFKNNTASRFQVDLAQHINLEGPWQVALTEISYPHTWFNIPIDKGFFEWRIQPHESDTLEPVVNRQRIRGGYYSELGQFRKEMNAFLKKIGSDVQMGYVNIQKRYEYYAGGVYQLRFFAPVAYILGVNPGEWILFDERLATHPADIKAGFYHLFCYSGIVKHQVVGDAYAPLLRIVDVKGTYGDVITQHFNPPYYLPVAKNHIENISVEIKTDQNQPIDFTFGKTVVKLHFRPVSSQR